MYAPASGWDWALVGLVLAATLGFALRGLVRTLRGRRSCCGEGRRPRRR